MKGIDILCASQAATAICLSTEQQQPSSSSPSYSASAVLLGGGGRAIDRHNPIVRDSRTIAKQVLPPCTATSQPPVSPKPHKNHHKKKINGDHRAAKKDGFSVGVDDDERIVKKSDQSMKNGGIGIGRKSWSCTRPSDFISPAGSARYLLSEKVVFNSLSDHFDPALKKFPAETSKKTDEKPPSSTSASENQVVVLRVSLHCRGCEKKMRKHISGMEGVTSFDIDFAAKKVTVSGNISPWEVLASISKVKNAQFWSPLNLNDNSQLNNITDQ